jgi:hypothetical protein
LSRIYNQATILVNIKSEINLCRDVKDNFLLSLAKDSNSDYLITGDMDLLILEKVGKTKIVTLTEFLENMLVN